MTELVAIEKYTMMKKVVVVPCKGSTGSHAAKMVIEFINACGDRDQDIILKTDPGPAIRFFIDSNGVVERAAQAA